MPPNVLLVVLDSVRACNTSLYRHTNRTTPYLERLAGEATVYEQARAPAARSLDSHASMLTGLHVAEHGVTEVGQKLRPGTTVFDDLGDCGYATGVFTGNSFLTDVDVGLRDAFDTVEGERHLPFPDALDPSTHVLEHGQGAYRAFLRAALSSETPLRALVNGAAVKFDSDLAGYVPSPLQSDSHDGTPYVERFLDWSADVDGQWAACVNLMDAHHPYLPRPEHDEWGGPRLRRLHEDISDAKWEYNAGTRAWWERRALEELYDGTIRQVDALVEQLIESLRERGDLAETLVVVTSDHGEGFGEQDLIRPNVRVASHGDAFHETVLHVPLVVRYPDEEAGRVTDPVSLTRFADAARATVENGSEAGRAAFRTGPVVASVPGLSPLVRARAANYCTDEQLKPFCGHARVVYEAAELGVEKYVEWDHDGGTELATVHAPDVTTCYRTDDTDGGRVEATFVGIEDAGVRETGTDPDDLDDAARNRLEHLGYV